MTNETGGAGTRVEAATGAAGAEAAPATAAATPPGGGVEAAGGGSTCRDCRSYLAVDVLKGLCKHHRTHIGADDASCPSFARAPKCKGCQHFTPSPTDAWLGLCAGAAPTYPDLSGRYCEDFLAR